MRKLISIFFIILIASASVIAGDAGLMKEAKTAFSKKAYGEAIKKFTKHTELFPNQGEAFMYLGYIYEYKKDYPRSINNFRKAAELDLEKDQRKTVLLKLALFFNYHQDWNLAATYSSRYLKYNPGNEEMQKIYNRATSNRGSPNANTYIQPNKQETKPEVKKVEAVKSDIDKKQDDVKKTAIKTEDAYEQALEEQPNNEDLRWDYVLTLFEEKKYDKAEKQLNLLIEKNPSRTRYHYKLGIVKLRQDDPKAAIDSFARAKKNPFSKDTNVFLYYVYLNEGLAFQKLNDLDKAEESFLEAHKQLPKEMPLLALARLYEQKTSFESCVTYSDKTLALVPESSEAHMYRFICLFELEKRTKKFETSYTKYKQVATASLNLTGVSTEKYYPGYLKLARKLLEENAFEKAEEFFVKLEQDPSVNGTREYLFYRGKSFFYNKKYEEALSLLQKVQGSSAAHYLVARIYSKKQDLVKLKENFKIAADLKPDYWTSDTLEKDFKEVWKDPIFKDFLEKRGADVSTPPSPSTSAKLP